MEKKYIFYVGPEHHKSQLNFTKELIGGDFFVIGDNTQEKNIYDNIKSIDAENVVWFFADLYENILPFLKGKAVFIPHGLGFKPFLVNNKSRVGLLKEHIKQIWSSGFLEENKYIDEGIDFKKIKRIGYTVPYDIPRLPVVRESLFIHFGCFRELCCWQNIFKFVESVPSDIPVFLAMHPSMPCDIKEKILVLVQRKSNITYAESQDDLLQAFALASRAIVGLGSVATSFHYLKKPVIYMKDKNRFPFFQWTRLRSFISDRLFFKVLSESTKLLAPLSFDRDIVMNAPVSKSASGIFYESNYDKKLTVELIHDAVNSL